VTRKQRLIVVAIALASVLALLGGFVVDQNDEIGETGPGGFVPYEGKRNPFPFAQDLIRADNGVVLDRGDALWWYALGGFLLAVSVGIAFVLRGKQEG